MHIIPIPQPSLRLRAHLLPSAPVPLRRHPRPEALNQVLDHEARLRQHQGFPSGVRSGRDADDGRFAQRVHGFELGGREHLLAFVGAEGVGEVELFEEPEHALGAGFLEPVWGGGKEGVVSEWVIE